MATQEEVDYFKLVVGSELFTDTQLSEILDAFPDKPNAAAAQVWEIRAGRYHTMVDIAESGSSRKMSDLHKNALAMAAYYNGRQKAEDDAEGEEELTGRSGTRRITRA